MMRKPHRLDLLLLPLLMAAVAEPAPAEGLEKHQATSTHMGTQFHVVLYAADEASANMAFHAAFERIADIDRALTNYDAGSELNQLSRGAPHETGVVVSDDLWRVLRAADRLSRQSGGAFDATVGPLTKLWRRARRQKVLPDRGRLQSALDAVGYRLVSFDEQSRAVQLGRPQMQLDLGGIAKGYAVDEALRVLASRGIDRALVNGGGDLAVTAPPPGQSGWQIDTATLDAETPGRRLEVHHAAVATSGDLWQFVEIDGVRYSHILNPHTGLGITRQCSVTVVAPTCMLADGLASAVSVLGPDAGIALVDSQPDTEAVVFEATEVGDGKKIERHASRGFDQLKDEDAAGADGCASAGGLEARAPAAGDS